MNIVSATPDAVQLRPRSLPATGPLPVPHLDMMRATAKRSVERIIRPVRELLPAAVPTDLFDVERLLGGGGPDSVEPGRGRLVWRVGNRAVEQPIAAFRPPAWSLARPVRRIGTYRGATSRIGTYPFKVADVTHSLEAESRLEMSWMRALHATGGVDWMMTQPFAMVWPISRWGVVRFPDILARIDGSWTVIDVKPPSHINERVAALFALTEATLKIAGVRWMHAGDLSEQAQIHLRDVSRYREPNDYWSAVAREVARWQPSTAGEVLWLCEGLGVGSGREVLFHLVAHGFVQFDLDAPLTRSTRLTWVGHLAEPVAA